MNELEKESMENDTECADFNGNNYRLQFSISPLKLWDTIGGGLGNCRNERTRGRGVHCVFPADGFFRALGSSEGREESRTQ
jgi:hypothetical protein